MIYYWIFNTTSTYGLYIARSNSQGTIYHKFTDPAHVNIINNLEDSFILYPYDDGFDIMNEIWQYGTPHFFVLS